MTIFLPQIQELDPVAQRGRKVHLVSEQVQFLLWFSVRTTKKLTATLHLFQSHQAVLENRVLLVPVVLLVLVVLQDNQVVLVHLEPLVLLVVLEERDYALMELKEKMDSLEDKDPKVTTPVELVDGTVCWAPQTNTVSKMWYLYNVTVMYSRKL